MVNIDKESVRHSFSHAAAAYTQAAVMQHQTAVRLASLTQEYRSSTAEHILDLGCGGHIFAEYVADAHSSRIVGFDLAEPMLKEAAANYQQRRTVSLVCGDCEALPFTDSSFDLIYASSVLHWCNNILMALKECRRILTNTGQLLMATYGPETLHELRNSWARVDSHSHTLDFPSLKTWERWLNQAGFSVQLSHCQVEVALYDSPRDLLMHLKRTGVKNFSQSRSRSLLTVQQLQMMQNDYAERYQVNGQVPASYEVLFLAAKAK